MVRVAMPKEAALLARVDMVLKVASVVEASPLILSKVGDDWECVMDRALRKSFSFTGYPQGGYPQGGGYQQGGYQQGGYQGGGGYGGGGY
jgi:uncharacterized membrane protein YgcG